MMKTAKNDRLRGMLVLMALITIFAGQEAVFAKNMFAWRTVLLPSLNFGSADQTQAVVDYLPRMKAAGYNGLFLDSFLMPRLHALKPETKANVARIVAEARQNGIAVIPMGEGQGMNAFMDTTLVEAFPCKATPFVVRNGVAEVKDDPAIALHNGGFEDGLNGWQVNRTFFSVDSTIKKSGIASLRCDDPTKNYLRASQNVTVRPFRTYELSMWVKTQNVVNYPDPNSTAIKAKNIGFTVQSPANNYIFDDRQFRNGLSPNNGWKQIKVCFHSLDRSNVLVQAQVTKRVRFHGTAWLDDVRIREVGLVETVIRQNMNVVVKNQAGQELAAGRDYQISGATLTIPAGSSVQEGDELLVDWYKSANVVSRDAAPSFCYDNVWNGVRSQIALSDEWFDTPQARIMKYSEWRLAGWDPICAQQYQVDQVGSGRYMDAVANITSALYKEANGSRLSLVFNDAFDPYHNSKSSYYVVHGGCVGSGYALDEDVIVMNWNVHNRKKSLLYFAGTEAVNRPHFGVKTSKQRQIISSGVGDKTWNEWLSSLSEAEAEGKLPDGSVIGISYHTYQEFPEHYGQIERMADLCEKAGRWMSGPIPFPAATPGIPYTEVGVKREAPKMVASNQTFRVTGGTTSGNRGLHFAVPSKGMVRLSLHNIRGQQVAQIVNEEMAQGDYIRHVDVSRLAPGAYFAKLVVGGTRMNGIARKILVF